jgi:methyl-accepting chemotaxis protein
MKKEIDFRTSERTAEASNNEGAAVRDSLLSRLLNRFITQPLINAITKEMRTIMDDPITRLELLEAQLRDGVSQLTANIASETDQQNAIVKDLRDAIEALKAGNPVDPARLTALANDLEISVNNVSAAANAVKNIVPDTDPAPAPEPAPEPTPEPSPGDGSPG